jgi:hypothetical protein
MARPPCSKFGSLQFGGPRASCSALGTGWGTGQSAGSWPMPGSCWIALLEGVPSPTGDERWDALRCLDGPDGQMGPWTAQSARRSRDGSSARHSPHPAHRCQIRQRPRGSPRGRWWPMVGSGQRVQVASWPGRVPVLR